MQIFLPFKDLQKSVSVLDNKRCGKQRIESWQILKILLNLDPSKKGWRNHPAVLMWKGYEPCLFNIDGLKKKIYKQK